MLQILRKGILKGPSSLSFTIKTSGTQGDGSLRTYLNATPAADTALSINPCGPLDNNGPGRTVILAYPAPQTFLRLNNSLEE
jgi:hypothetical protein